MELPNDLVLEILSWLPLDQASKIRVLSKFHNKVSYHSYYKELAYQHQREPVLDGFLFQTLSFSLSFVSPQPDNNSPSLDLSLSYLPGRNPKIQAVAPNGLLLCETRHPIHYNKIFYIITKLSTKQWKGLPIPKTRFLTENIAMYVIRSNPLHFKILRLSQDEIPSKRPMPFAYTICEIFDSESWQWKQLNDLVHDNDLGFVQSNRAPVLVYGSAHWKFNDKTSIFAFDFHSENWSRIAMPDTIIKEHEDIIKKGSFPRWQIDLVDYEGKLGVMREFRGLSTELWIMEKYNYNERIWIKKCDFSKYMPIALYGSNILMIWLYNDNNVIFSNIETGEYSYKKLEQCHYSMAMVFPFSSDFKSWNFDPPKRSIKPKTMAKILRQNEMHMVEELNL